MNEDRELVHKVHVDSERALNNLVGSYSTHIDTIIDEIEVAQCPQCMVPITFASLVRGMCRCQREIRVVVVE